MKSKFNASGLTALLCCMIALILLAAGVYKLLDPLIAVNALGKTVPGLRPEVRLNVVYSIASVEVQPCWS